MRQSVFAKSRNSKSGETVIYDKKKMATQHLKKVETPVQVEEDKVLKKWVLTKNLFSGVEGIDDPNIYPVRKEQRKRSKIPVKTSKDIVSLHFNENESFYENFLTRLKEENRVEEKRNSRKMYKELGMLTVKKTKKVELPDISHAVNNHAEDHKAHDSSLLSIKKDKPKKIKTLSESKFKPAFDKKDKEKDKGEEKYTAPLKVIRESATATVTATPTAAVTGDDNKSSGKTSSKKLIGNNNNNQDMTKEDKNTIQLFSNFENPKLNASGISLLNNDRTKSVPKNLLPPTPKKHSSSLVKYQEPNTQVQIKLPLIESENSRKNSIPIHSKKQSKNSFNLKDIRKDMIELKQDIAEPQQEKQNEEYADINKPQNSSNLKPSRNSKNLEDKIKERPFCGCFSFFN